MIQDLVTFASVIIAAAIASQAALTAWRRQQRREVYGAFIAATDDALESLDLLLLVEHTDALLSDLDQWEEFHQARRKFDIAWGQVRLVAPTNVTDHARKTGFSLLDFDRGAKNLSVGQARDLRKDNLYLNWDLAESFVTAARRDLKVEPWIVSIWRRHEINDQTPVMLASARPSAASSNVCPVVLPDQRRRQ